LSGQVAEARAIDDLLVSGTASARAWAEPDQSKLRGERSSTNMPKLNIRPIGDKVIVKRVEMEDKTAGGIVLPDTAKEKPKRGVIMAVGNGKLLDDGRRSEMQVKRNDEVVFTSYAGSEVKIEGEEYLIMDESDILGVVEK
jgi:chaperonin GroES